MINRDELLKMAREAGFSMDCDWKAASDYLCDECDIISFANAILERAAVECENRSMKMSDTAKSHKEDSPSRDRCMARSREAAYCAQDIRALKTQGE